MQNVKVLGTNCPSCKTTQKLIEEVVSEHEIAISLEKVEDVAQIMSYGVMSTPAVIIDGKIAHAGAVPDKKTILSWFQSGGCCSGGQCCKN
jgi:small redox-active disulfide protein 2